MFKNFTISKTPFTRKKQEGHILKIIIFLVWKDI